MFDGNMSVVVSTVEHRDRAVYRRVVLVAN